MIRVSWSRLEPLRTTRGEGWSAELGGGMRWRMAHLGFDFGLRSGLLRMRVLRVRHGSAGIPLGSLDLQLVVDGNTRLV